VPPAERRHKWHRWLVVARRVQPVPLARPRADLAPQWADLASQWADLAPQWADLALKAAVDAVDSVVRVAG
jgi:hypothetical protein